MSDSSLTISRRCARLPHRAIATVIVMMFAIFVPRCSKPQPLDEPALHEPAATSASTDALPQWNGRQPFFMPDSLIYAGSASAAKEIEKEIARVIAGFVKETGARPTRGLVLVTDAKDALLQSDTHELFLLAASARATRSPTTMNTPAATQSAEETDPEMAWQRAQEPMKKLGLAMDAILRSLAFPIDESQLARLSGFPAAAAQGVDWIVALPTRATCRKSADEILAATLRHDGITLAQRLLIAPWVPVMKSAATDELIAQRDPTIIDECIRAQSWSESEKDCWRRTYASRLQSARKQRTALQQKMVNARTRITAKPPSASAPAAAAR